MSRPYPPEYTGVIPYGQFYTFLTLLSLIVEKLRHVEIVRVIIGAISGEYDVRGKRL